MKRIATLISLVFSLLSVRIHAQEAGSNLLLYTHGVRAKGALLLNIQGYEIIVDKASGDFSKPYLSRMFPGFDLHQGYKTVADSSLGFPALLVDRSPVSDGASAYSVCYFIQKNKGTILGISIAGAKRPTKVFEQQLASLFMKDGVPDSLISAMGPVSLQFVGRNIEVGGSCRWMGSNTMQCSGHGEMNWSMHPDMDEARQQTMLQIAENTTKKHMNVELDTEVSVVFEGSAVTARKVQYHIKGALGLLAKKEGSRTLICYYVTAPVRGRYVSCAMSYWTSDFIQENGLPLLLGQVMELK